MTSPDGSDQASMEDILASIRKIVASEPAQQATSSDAPPKANGAARKTPPIAFGTELPRAKRDEEAKSFFTPLPERASPLFRRPSETDPEAPSSGQDSTASASPKPAEPALADVLEDFGAPAADAAQSDDAIAEAAPVTPPEAAETVTVAAPPEPPASAAPASHHIDFSVLAAPPKPEPAPLSALPAAQEAPPAHSAAAVGRALADEDDNEFIELPDWAVAAAVAARPPLDGTVEPSAALPEFDDLPQPGDPLSAAIARVASAIAPVDDTELADSVDAAMPAVPEPSPVPEPSEHDPTEAANSALSELAAGLAASAERQTELPPPPALPPPVAPALPPAGPIPLVAPEAVFEQAVSKLVKPMLEKWLADNMPRIIENALRAEVGETTGSGKPRS